MPIKSRWQTEIPLVTIPTYLFQSPTHPLSDKPIFIDPERPDTHYLSLSSYRLWCQRLAAGLRAAGLQPGDRVLLYSGNTVYFPVVLLGVMMAEGIFTGANPGYVARELAYQLSDSGAKFLIAAEGSLSTALEAASSIGMSKDRIFVFDSGPATFENRGRPVDGVRHWTSLCADEAAGLRFSWREDRSEEQANETVALNYSSGTTGIPKGVEITHRNYVANCCQTGYVARLSANHDAMLARTRWLCFLPMYHAYGQTYYCISGPKRGIPTFVMPKFDLLKMLQYVQRFRISELFLVPPVVVALVKQPATRGFDLSSIEQLGSGAAPLGREVCVELESLLGGKVNVKQGWGMTESTCTVLSYHPDDTAVDAAVGELAPNCEAKIMDDGGANEVPNGQRGELWVRAPNVMKGYWRRPEATKGILTPDGWLQTGDIAYVDRKALFHIVDRKKELIKVKGNQVAPAELEALLLEHPAVADAAVIGVAVAGDELPRAYVVLHSSRTATAHEIASFLSARVTKTKRLTGGVRFVDKIPKNPSGKILRKVLREAARAEIGDSKPRAARL